MMWAIFVALDRGCTTEAGKLAAKRRAQVSWWQKLAMKWRSKESNDELTGAKHREWVGMGVADSY